jgi:hypothetical protein
MTATNGTPRIAAGSMMFESWDIAPALISHLVSQGIVDFYIVDHRSSGNPLDTFLREVPVEARIHWVRKNSTLYSQSPTMTALAHLARQDGFDAFVPFDSDEFFTSTSGLLVDHIGEWLATSETRALRCLMENFYQSQSVENFTARDLASVHYRAEYGDVPSEHFVDTNDMFARYKFSARQHKSIMRLVPGPDGDFDWLSTGNHRVINVLTGERCAESTTRNVSVLHLPCRSKSGLTSRRAHMLREKDQSGNSHDTADAEFAMMESERDYEWQRASVPDGTSDERIVISGVHAVRDERIADLCDRIAQGVRKKNSPPVPYIDETSRMADTALDLAQPIIQLTKQATGRNFVAVENRSVLQLERKIARLQAQITRQRPSLLRSVINRIRRR